jgi:GH18 family chitinase
VLPAAISSAARTRNRSQRKGALVRAQGLGGTIIWTISQDHLVNRPPGQRDPLLDAVRAAFLE